jgi:hypothetical protein
MQSSEVPKIIRWRLFLQGFDFAIAHIPGSKNNFADWLSRDFVEPELPLMSFLTSMEPVVQLFGVDPALVAKPKSDVDKVIELVHNSRMGHFGVRRTWKLLNKHVPGHGISTSAIKDYIDECIWCQKLRQNMADSIPAPVRAIRSEHDRSLCGYDTLYVTPADDEGFQYLHVFKLFPSRLVGLYPSKDLTADSLALALFQFFVTYGTTDVLITDSGK